MVIRRSPREQVTQDGTECHRGTYCVKRSVRKQGMQRPHSIRNPLKMGDHGGLLSPQYMYGVSTFTPICLDYVRQLQVYNFQCLMLVCVKQRVNRRRQCNVQCSVPRGRCNQQVDMIRGVLQGAFNVGVSTFTPICHKLQEAYYALIFIVIKQYTLRYYIGQ